MVEKFALACIFVQMCPVIDRKLKKSCAKPVQNFTQDDAS